jgi:hypothetical protein
MYLASAANILSQLGFSDMSDINFAIGSALDAAEATLASALDTDFTAATQVDTFYVKEPPYVDGPAFETQFRLRHGVVTSLTSVVYAQSAAGLSDPTQFVDVTSGVMLHQGKGVVTDIQFKYCRQFVQITYQKGFAPDPASGNPPTSYLLTGVGSVPTWLQEAARLQAIFNMVDLPVLSEAQIKLDKNIINGQLQSIMMRHLRYAPMAVLPL